MSDRPDRASVEQLGFSRLDYNGRVGTHAWQRVPVMGCHTLRRLRNARPAACTGRPADRRAAVCNSASVGEVLSVPPRRDDGVCCRDDQGERIPRPP